MLRNMLRNILRKIAPKSYVKFRKLWSCDPPVLLSHFSRPPSEYLGNGLT
jgi:hypothetical protein